jgi:hypothetical protein
MTSLSRLLAALGRLLRNWFSPGSTARGLYVPSRGDRGREKLFPMF